MSRSKALAPPAAKEHGQKKGPACSFGGQVGGVAITAANVADYAVGNKTMTTPAVVTYWNGN